MWLDDDKYGGRSLFVQKQALHSPKQNHGHQPIGALLCGCHTGPGYCRFKTLRQQCFFRHFGTKKKKKALFAIQKNLSKIGWLS